jgi:PAS domain S-box-containing protein
MGITVLYVDDEPALLALGRTFLERNDPDLSVFGVESTNEALDALGHRQFDVVVADYQMPDRDGLEFLREVREKYGRLPFILLTGRGGEDVAIDALNLGADFYLQKGGNPRARYLDLAHKIRTSVERRRAEIALTRSEARFRSYFQIPLIGIAILSPDGHVLDANKKACDIFGYATADLEGRSWVDLVPSEDRGLEEIGFLSVFDESEGGAPRDVRFETASGQMIDTIVSIAPVRQEGSVDLLVALIEDVTEQRRVARELQEREAGYRAVVEAMAEGLLIHVRGRTVFMNDAAARILGLESPLDGIGRPVLDWVDPDDTELASVWARSSGMLMHISQQGRLSRRDGTSIEIETTAVPVVFQNEEAVQLVFRDVTAVYAQARALEESEERYRTIFERAGEGILILTREPGDDPRIVAANQAAAAYYGGSVDALVGRELHLLETETNADSIRSRMATLQGGEWLHGSTYHQREDGMRFPVDYSIGLIEFGESTRVLAFVRDVTERRMAQDALVRANAKLNLLSSITRHDILNQVTALLMYLELSLEDTADPSLRTYVEKEFALTKNIERLISFTKDYQDIGIRPPVWQRLDESVRRGFHAAGGRLRISLEMEPVDYEVYADSLYPAVFSHIAQNTEKHAPEAQYLRVSATETERGLAIICEDDGPGLSEAARAGCFKRRVDGGGWGLCLCRDILSITGIEISETGREGSGARFEILVPKHAYRRAARQP